MYLDRIRDTTSRYAERNRERLNALAEQGLDVFVADDYRDCRRALARVEQLLSRDPEQARDENIRLSGMMRGLNGRARGNRRAAQAAEREAAAAAAEAEREIARERLAGERDARIARNAQELAAQENLLDMLRKARASLPSAIERDLCQQDLMALRREIESEPIELAVYERRRSELASRLDTVMAGAREKAQTLKHAEQREDDRREKEALLEDALAVYAQLGDDLAQAAISGLRPTLTDEGLTLQDLDERLSAIRQAADERALQEAARRHVVSGLLRELRNAGFIVFDPKLEAGEVAAVVIKAQRPSGAQAAFRVNLDEMTYKFDHYQGQACLDDADKVLPRLQDIYGIELEEEKVSWRNPDMIGKSAKQLPDGSEERRK
ncbi:hypothetical protein [Roseivivax marinus]|nr:hypothetical protein [Roseivivax marinus]